MSKNKCPKCGCQDCSITRSKEAMFQFARNRECDKCGTIWRPACPKWASYISILAGGLIFFIGISYCIGTIVELSRFSTLEWGIAMCAIVFGASGILYGVRVLLGKAGSSKILTEAATSQDGSASPVNARCAEEGKLHDQGKDRFETATSGDIAVSIIIPGWGLMVGLIALCKGERRRAAVMIAIGNSMILFYIVLFIIIHFIT